jgi:amidase
MDHNPRVEVHPDCAEATRSTAAMLEGLGHGVEQAHPEALDKVDEMGWAFGINWGVGAVVSLEHLGGQLGREVTADDVEPGTWFLAERGRDISAVDYARAQSAMGTFRRKMAAWWESGFDLLVTPTTALPPPRIGQLTPTEDDGRPADRGTAGGGLRPGGPARRCGVTARGRGPLVRHPRPHSRLTPTPLRRRGRPGGRRP